MADLVEKPLGCTCFKLRKLTRAMSRLYDQHLATVGLKTTQYSLLVNAARAALPVAELAELLGLERTTLTRNLRPLIAAGWLELKNGADARQRIVTISDAGREKVGHACVAWRRAPVGPRASRGAGVCVPVCGQGTRGYADRPGSWRGRYRQDPLAGGT